MKMLLLDTHIWIWYVTGSNRLPLGIKELIDGSSETPWLSPISAWEVAMLAQKKKLELAMEFRRWISEAIKKFPVREATLNLEVALKSQEIALTHKDPADHFIAATALIYDLLLITMDHRLTGLDWLPTFSG